MRFAALILSLVCLSNICTGADDVWELQSSGSTASLRGICGVSKTCCWASGSKGTVLRTVDGGTTWTSIGPPNSEAADFRDIHAWDELNAIIMSAGDVDRLYRTEDGGKSWSLVFEDKNQAAFFDGMAFDFSGRHAWLMGDPLDGHVYLLRSSDQGRSWQRQTLESSPKVSQGIAAFAASGTHLLIRRKGDLLIGLGGAAENAAPSDKSLASVLRTSDDGKEWHQISVPIDSNASSGIFSICDANSTGDRIIAVGGDYTQLDKSDSNIAISADGGKTWRVPSGNRPSGFRSVVVRISLGQEPDRLITVGPSGTDQSLDCGDSWTRISSEGFHAMSPTSDGTLWASGANGRIGRLIQ